MNLHNVLPQSWHPLNDVMKKDGGIQEVSELDCGRPQNEIDWTIDCRKTGVGGKLVITTGCNEACTDSSVDSATQVATLVVANVGFDEDCRIEVNNLLKCCSAAAGDTNCIATLAVAFVPTRSVQEMTDVLSSLNIDTPCAKKFSYQWTTKKSERESTVFSSKPRSSY